MSKKPYHPHHPQMIDALNIVDKLRYEMQGDMPDSVIVAAMLMQVSWLIGDLEDITTGEAAAMRRALSWFSDSCEKLVDAPPTLRPDRH
jgi:hypothetical protein